MSQPRVILFGYASSPFVLKVSTLLLLKQVPFELVQLDRMPPSPEEPRPELALLGITYRRVPLLSIDGDVYCDSSLIAAELERRFPAVDTGIIAAPRLQIVAYEAVAKPMFGFAVALLPDAVLKDPKFSADRTAFTGGERQFTPEFFARGRPFALAQLATYLSFIEENQKEVNGADWLLATPRPSYADLNLWFPLAFAHTLHARDKAGPVMALLGNSARFPHAVKWFGRMSAHIQAEKKRQGWKDFLAPRLIDARAAADFLKQAPRQPTTFDESDGVVQASKGALKQGAHVIVAPTDTGRIPQQGELVGLTPLSSTLKIAQSGVHISFPRLDYRIAPAQSGSKL